MNTIDDYFSSLTRFLQKHKSIVGLEPEFPFQGMDTACHFKGVAWPLIVLHRRSGAPIFLTPTLAEGTRSRASLAEAAGGGGRLTRQERGAGPKATWPPCHLFFARVEGMGGEGCVTAECVLESSTRCRAPFC